MGYTTKLNSDALTPRSLTCMAHSDRADDARTAIKPKFYLPAGGALSWASTRIDRVWSKLFNHGV